MKKVAVAVALVTTIGLGNITYTSPSSHVYAAKSLEDLNKQKEEIDDKQNNVNSEIEEKNKKITEVQSAQDEVKKEMTRLDDNILAAETKIKEHKEQISKTEAEIKELMGEIDKVKERMEKRNDLLKERARAFQETGGVVKYVDVLMGSQSIADFISRVGAVATILDADQNILEEQKADEEALESKQTKLEEKRNNIKDILNSVEQLKQELDEQKETKEMLMKELEKKEDEMESEKMSLEEEKEILAKQEAAMEKAIKLEKERIANQQNAASTPKVSSGTFTKPAQGVISSGYGARWNKQHAGIDIASTGAVAVVAAADGVVIRSYDSSSYGQVVFISHSIDGQVYTTVYAHMRDGSRKVNEGDVVKKGQQIGVMGNTGQSTGQHLHFELHKGPWNYEKSNAINPIGIVPL